MMSKKNFYHIAEKKKLLIIDAHDTIFKRDLSRSTQNIFLNPDQKDKVEWRLRSGFTNFLDFFKGIRKAKIVISSDGDQDRLHDLCTRFGIIKQIDAIYGYNHIHKETFLKQLDLILNDLNVLPEEAVFIGDGKIDEYSAKKYGVQYIKVPNTLEDLTFSFNVFFPQEEYGTGPNLELQNLVNFKKVYHNCTSPCLVEFSIKQNEGKLAHLGALAVDSGNFHKHLGHGRYIVKEPSSENRIDWQNPAFEPFDAQHFHLLQLRLQAFLQDREIFVQDCYVGSQSQHQKPLRIITQTAWHSLFARNMFVQGSITQLQSFFPEFTVIHVPFFKAIPDLDGTKTEEFVIINLLKKIALIGGTSYAGEIRRAIYMLMGYFYLEEDVLPVKCSSNQGKNNGDTAFYYGEASTTKSSITLNKDRFFLGDAFHGWSNTEVFNLEWGSYLPVSNLSMEKSEIIFESCHKFATILENTHITDERRINFNEPYSDSNARASFPITHIDDAVRSGIGQRPQNVFIIIKDGLGILPPLVQLSREQAIVFLLLGYNSEMMHDYSESIFSENARFFPFFKDHPFVLKPSVYALYLWEKLESSQSKCWLLNKSHFGSLKAGTGWFTKSYSLRLVNFVFENSQIDLTDNLNWGFRYLNHSPFPKELEDYHFNITNVWPDYDEYLVREKALILKINEIMEPYIKDLDPPIVNSIPKLIKKM